MKVKWTQTAIGHLADVYDYISHDSAIVRQVNQFWAPRSETCAPARQAGRGRAMTPFRF